ncbi:uncharacterized protein BDR25DRAFT_276918 [Lindgomyces ingoldianus]|uniref:Uncharacterized protein n=1 Tax=Lindgomyces ingoldianus TaxID=673940 RepID=A0ACB6RCY2_9PLEO|nr:uncharacterized protein BDR25DRAFT_276918 [Lindgomyces ingoldianus]KAF2477184.1 hypothetical protein BDR25DRAFT_276918 [Lindgomyces ingoldianus]
MDEKVVRVNDPNHEEGVDLSNLQSSSSPKSTGLGSRFQRWNARIESLSSFEARGIARVPSDKREATSHVALVQMVLLWFSANITINNLAVGLLGPLLFKLGFLDSSLCAVFGAALGGVSTAYMATWGAASGCRTMVVGRYFMGYYPSKICALLNIILMVGYCTIDCIIGGQVLSAVSGGTMSIAVGIVVVAIVVLVIAVIGLKIFHVYERYAWLPQLLVLFILIGSAGPYFSTSLTSVGSPRQIAANRLSFFSLCFYVPNSWAAAASDFYVYYPERTSKWRTFVFTYTGLTLSFSLVNMLGVGLASGVATHSAWADAYATSSGALITAGYAPLGSFGKFCAVIVALGVIANSVPGTYSAALGCQMMGRYGKVIPRWIWAIVLVLIQLVCALVGRNQLFIIFQNFLALMGYWLMIMVCIVAEEHVLFRWRRGIGFDWTAWEDRTRLPIGIAALSSFLLGWMGAVLGMYQVWYVGPIAILAGDTGADVGMWVGCGFALITFPPIRSWELKVVGR